MCYFVVEKNSGGTMRFLTQDLKDLRAGFLTHGFDLRLVGGCVRDHLMGMSPKDVDLCTDATPAEQVLVYETLGLRHVPTGIDHGTITVVLSGVPYEITSLRTETEHDGRHATVAYTRDWVEDLSRRDLTINAMSLTFDGVLIDPFGGKADLDNKAVRFVGKAEERIREDYLRILRWFRFHGRIAGDAPMDRATEDAVEFHAEGLRQISRERVWMEMSKIVSGPAGDTMLKNMVALGIVEHIDLPPACWHVGVPIVRSLTRHPVTIMAALLGDAVLDVARAWKWSSEETALARYLVANGDHRGLWSGPAVHPCTLAAMQAEVTLKNVAKDKVVELARLKGLPEIADALLAWEPPVFPVGGQDLIDLGMTPGPEMGRALKTLKEAWAASGYALTREALLGRIAQGKA